MRADSPELKQRFATVDMDLPLPSKVPAKRRPQSYSELLIWEFKNTPVRPTLRKRLMLPIRHFLVLVMTLFLSGLLFLGLGYFLWRVLLPDSYSIQSPDLNSILLGGWGVVVGVFGLAIFLSWMQTMVGLFCCGKGLHPVLE